MMNPKYFSVYIAIILLVLPLGISAQQASSALEADTLAVGDTFHFTLMMRDWQEYDEVIYPDSTQFGSDFEILDRSELDDGMIKSITYELQYFGAGNTYVPDLEIGLRSGSDTTYVATPGRSFVFEAMVEDESEAFRPFKPLFDFPALAFWIWLAVLAFIIVAGVLAYLYWKEKTRIIPEPEEPEPEPEPAWESPLDRLNIELWRIRQEYQPPLEYYEQLFRDLSYALRGYLSEVHEIPALESTYKEIETQLDRRMMPKEMRSPLSQVLQLCDRVKFAGYRPQQQDVDEALQKAGEFSTLAAEYDRGLMHLMRIFEEETEAEQNDAETVSSPETEKQEATA